MSPIKMKAARYAIILGGFLLLLIAYLGSRTIGYDQVVKDRVMEFTPACATPPPPPPPSSLMDMLLPSVAAAEAVQTYQRMLVRNGSMEFEVKNVSAVHDSIGKIAAAMGGYIASEQQTNNDYRQQYRMTIRVVGAKYEAAFSSINALAFHLDTKSSHVEDVTDHYIDLDTRLRNKQKVEESIALLLKKAVKMEDILTIESKLGDIRSEIESLQGQLQVIKRDVAFSTIDLTFYKVLRERTVARHSFWGQFADAFITGWSNFLGFINGLMAIWPFIIIIVALVFWALRAMKKRDKKYV